MELPPLENPLILTHLFSICPPSLLKSCRLVCQQWHKVSLPIWRSSFPIKFKRERRIGYVMNKGRSWRDSSLQDFVEYVESPEHEYRTIPHRHFSLRGWAFGKTQEKDRLLRRFWCAITPGLTNLELINCTFTDAVAFRKLIFQPLPSLRKLTLYNCSIRTIHKLAQGDMGGRVEESVYEEHLHLQSLSIYRSKLRDDFPVSFLELLGHFPWITSLESITRDTYPLDACLSGLLMVIKVIREGDKRKLPLVNFNCLNTTVKVSEERDSLETLALLSELHIPVKSLRIPVKHEMDHEVTERAIVDHKETIRTLRIYQDILTGPRLTSWSIPITVRLNNLQELLLEYIPLQNMNFLQFTLNLEKFVISDARSIATRDNHHLKTMMIARTCIEMRTNLRLLHLKHFDLDYVVRDEDVQELVGWMPNVTILAMDLNAKQFEVVCGHLKNVEDLKLKSGSVVLTDEMICGRKLQQVDGAAMGEPARRPNITNLSGLKTIQFGENKLTDVSVFDGFLHLSRLTQIEASVRFGQAAKDALREKNVHVGVGPLFHI